MMIIYAWNLEQKTWRRLVYSEVIIDQSPASSFLYNNNDNSNF